MGLAISTANSSLFFSIDWPTDDDGSRRDDIVGAKIWMSQTDGFTPGESSLAHDGPDLSAVVPGLETGAVYYVRYAIVSGIDQDDVAISDQITAPAVNDADTATVIRLVTEDPVVSQSSDGSFAPASITFRAEIVSGNGLPSSYAGRFRITLNGTGVTTYQSTEDESSTTFTIPEGTTKIWCALFAAGGTTTRLDAMTVPVVLDGSSALTVVVTNPAHAVPCSSAGTPTSYVGSGTDIRVYVGDDELTYDGAGTTKGTWTVSAAGSGITPGSVSDSGSYATIGAHSGMTTDTASVSYTITGKRAGGAAFSRTVKQSLVKANTGAPGQTGQQGPRGAGNFYTAVANAGWSDTAANDRIAVVTGSYLRVVGDSVTETYSTTWTLTKVWDGTAWAAPGTVIDGALLVTGTVQSSAIDTRSLTIKNASGTTRASVDGSGNLMLSGDIVLDGGDVYGKEGKFSALHGSSSQGSASCYCYASDYTKPYLYGAAALRSAWSNALDEAVGGAGSWIVYSVLAEGSDYGGIPYSSTIRGTINGSQAFILSQNECTFRGKIKGIRSVATGSLTDAAMHLTASFGALVFDSDANKCISWNDGSSLAMRSGHRTSGSVDAVTVAGDGAVKIVCNTNAQNGFCGIYAAPKTMTAGAAPSWVHNITISSVNGVQISGNTVWHAGNDGAGSGLDADKMDGQDGSYYLNYANFTGTVAFSAIQTGTTSSTVALGDHTHSAYAAASHTQAWSTITSTPTTRAGYGITDAAASTHTHSDYASKSTGNTFSGGQTINNVLNVNGTVATQYLRPDADNTRPLGGSSYRWTQLFAATATINTSDAREKTDVVGLSDAEIAAAVELSKRIGMFQFLDAIAVKGSDARWHIGMTVQDVADLFVAHGLDPWRYGFMCYDSWAANEADGLESGDGYGFRTEELLLFIAAGINARMAALEVDFGQGV